MMLKLHAGTRRGQSRKKIVKQEIKLQAVTMQFQITNDDWRGAADTKLICTKV